MINCQNLALIIFLNTVLLLTPALMGQEKAGAIVGVVKDEHENVIDNVNAFIVGTPLGTVSDDNGRFSIQNVRPGKYTIQFSFIGYKTAVKENVPVENGKVTMLDVTLSRMILNMPEIVVTPGAFRLAQQQTSRRQSMLHDQLNTLPATFNDVNRVLHVMPGVSFSHDGSAHFHVRGGNQEENLILLDGVEIFDPYHLKNLGGAVGIINMELVEKVEMLTGGFPAKYGDKLSSVVNVVNRVSDANRLAGSIGIGGTGSKMLLEGPLPRGSWLVSYRKSFLREAIKILNPSENTFVPTFYDAQAKVQVRLNSSNQLIFNLLMSDDHSTFNKWILSRDLSSNYGNRYIGLVWKSVLRPGLFSKLLYSNGMNRRHNRVDDEDAELLNLKEDLYQWHLETEPRDGHNLQMGISYKKIRYRYYLNPELMWQSQRELETLLEMYFGKKNIIPSTYKASMYLQYRWNWKNLVIVNSGVRFDRFEYNDDSHWSPRLGLAYSLTDKTIIRAAWGYFYQSPVYARLSQQKGADTNPGAEQAIHSIIGVEHFFKHGLNIRVEAYYKKLSRMIGYTVDTKGDQAIPEVQYGNPHHGYATGLELFAHGNLSGKLQIWFSYSLSRTRLQTSVINWDDLRIENKFVPRITDQPHNLACYLSYQLPHHWGLHLKWRLISGRPYTPKHQEYSLELGRMVWRDDAPNSQRYSMYHRLDVRIGRDFRLKWFDLSAYLEIQNVYNRKNLLLHDYAEDVNGRLYEKNYYMLPFLPTIELNVKF